MSLVRYFKANRKTPLYMLLVQGLGFLVGAAVVLIINTFANEDPTYACMGTLFTLCAAACGIFIRGNLNGSARFSLAISMGQTRRSYLLCSTLLSLTAGAIGIAVARTAYFLESWLYSVLYPGFQNEMPLDAVFQLKYLLPGLVVVVILELVLSAMMLRFGARTFSVMWLCFCFSFMILPRSVDAYMEGSVSFLARIGGVLVRGVTLLSPVGWAVVGGAVLLALLAFAVSVYRKAEVRL